MTVKTTEELKNMDMIDAFWKYLKYHEHQDISINTVYYTLLKLGMVDDNGVLTQKAKEL